MTYISNRRILLVDDTPSIHEDFRKILIGQSASNHLSDLEEALFDAIPNSPNVSWELDSAFQGQEGITYVEKSLQSKNPYAMAFIDMRMPPGMDGVETVEKIWQLDPRIQIVICTAYSDYSWEDVLGKLKARDGLLILKKPFDTIEIRQLASTLTAKWSSTEEINFRLQACDRSMDEFTSELLRTNKILETETQERKLLESQLIQSEKLASIGQLAAGVAHEINNPLGFIFSNFNVLETYHERLFEILAAYEKSESNLSSPEVVAQLTELRKRVELEYLKEDIPALMKESKDGVNRVSEIIQNLKDFSRVDSGDTWETANLHNGIDSTLKIISNETKYKADIIKEYGELPNIECIASQINQVIMNLIINAVHATKPQERGVVTIRTGTDHDRIWIEVADKGTGISEDTLQRIFDPFFTTKPIGKGTGLGLSLSYGIIQKHQGSIDVQSAVGRGTTFRVTLPVNHVEVVT